MKHLQGVNAIEEFIADVRTSILDHDDTQQKYFDMYANETIIGYSLIENDINTLPPSAEILAIGAGLLLLCGYLVFRAFRIHALEPIRKGFSHFYELQKL